MAEIDPAVVLRKAKTALDQDDHHTARRLCREVLSRRKNDLDALMLMSDIAGAAGRLSEQIDYVTTAVRIQPKDPRLRAHLGHRYVVTARYSKAMTQFEKALRLDPDHIAAIVGRAVVYERQNRYDMARAALALLVAKGDPTPDLAAVYMRILVHDGDLDEAVAIGKLVLAARRRPGHPLRSVCFTLAHAYELKGDYDRALEAASRGQGMLAAPFDPEKHAELVDSIIDVFTAERIRTMPRSGLASPVPMFIVGMPRTGSTLVDRIIHSHPHAHGADEIDAFHRVVNALIADIDSPQPYPKCIQFLTQAHVDAHDRSYMNELLTLAPRAQRITNKHLGNFMHLGLVNVLLPGARVIHCRRNPMDTCLSCFMSRLEPAQSPYASVLSHLGAFYRQYRRLMGHWRDVIDIEMLDVDYEELIADQEGVSRRVIEFCGLPWDDACLRFHEPKRHDRTISFDQVRRPLYGSSVARAERFGSRLDPLREALGGVPDAAQGIDPRR